MNRTAIIASTDIGIKLGQHIQKEFQKSVLVSTRNSENATTITSIFDFLENNFLKFDSFIFIGALGICVRSISSFIRDKNTDPAIVNMDEHGTFVQAVISGHAGGANDLAVLLAKAIGAQAVITTSSDVQGIWSLDTLGKEFGWKVNPMIERNKIISLFVNKKRTAVLLDVKDKGTFYLEKSKPDFVDIFYNFDHIDFLNYELFIAVTFRIYQVTVPSLYFHPPVLTVGMGCSRDIEPGLLAASFIEQMKQHHFSIHAVKAMGSIDVKEDEVAFIELAKTMQVPFKTFIAEELNSQPVNNPSEVVMSKLGVYSVSEASAMLLSGNSELQLEKQKITVSSGKKYTIAVALEKHVQRKGVVAIVGAGPGDAALISVKGKELLENADLILYAGSLIPVELTQDAKSTAIVRNSASMTLEEQMKLMTEHYKRGHLIVRLQSGDPSIYGAIQEQMSIFDDTGMDYFIVPGISSFQAAAASLRSEFTIPEVVQSIILTRGEGKTPLPEKEKLNEMARHQATMCIFLSATIAKDVQAQLLEHYAADTPVAVLYRVTWKDEKIFTGQLKDLAKIIRDSKLTLTILIIVGVAIGARKNRSHLYNPTYKHTFRTGKNQSSIVN